MSPLLPLLVLSGDPKLSHVAAQNVAAFRQAILRKDVAWFEKTYAPNFTQKVEGHPIDRATALGQLRKGLLKMPLRGLKTTLAQVKPSGKGYVATVKFEGILKATIQGQPSTLTAKWTDDQTWIPEGKAWRISSLSTRGFDRTITIDK